MSGVQVLQGALESKKNTARKNSKTAKMADIAGCFGCNYFLFRAFLLPVRWNKNEQDIRYIDKTGVK
jgi:hypothetical protein